MLIGAIGLYLTNDCISCDKNWIHTPSTSGSYSRQQAGWQTRYSLISTDQNIQFSHKLLLMPLEGGLMPWRVDTHVDTYVHTHTHTHTHTHKHTHTHIHTHTPTPTSHTKETRYRWCICGLKMENEHKCLVNAVITLYLCQIVGICVVTNVGNKMECFSYKLMSVINVSRHIRNYI